ncbi:sigma-70 family RNA polymerase sigma factor [Conexibacter sp. JD483]|uniref:RNA polymerase sigma factor n=1 Tax=unclassified Conexibacter TaxID=2627773 RepID=UPI0027200CEE|nr:MULTISPECIES: sigma-70 family RNA polymerase sigma factor [unclassified Conexibacter]MDO8189497.1 sigma-70 family RNA polymerase sigma factor [Conexibacter sp. CPCC 205706]MDO8198175.1 sigma-70 family RNA polymerase sigma factor [Conexibacter sp. CPCC 205762]MDR9372778.1 sigma-70 family RNA polymerase sigma factor [Conexibacter sp. JD483]
MTRTPTTPADRRLLQRAQAGDPAAFETLIEPHDRQLRRLAFRMLGDRGAMDDALQEAYVKAYRSLPRFAGDAAFGTWLYRIVANACNDELRRGARRRGDTVLDEARDVAAGAPGPDRAAAAHLDLAAALDAIPPDLRSVVLLVDAEGMSYDEAGEVLGVPAGTVASRLNRARAALRPALAGYGEVPS